MRIDRLNVSNFKGFKDLELSLHPQFNLVVGENGSGKTSVLDALAVAAGSWFLGLRGYDSRHIRSEDIRLRAFEIGEDIRWEQQIPCSIAAIGEVRDRALSWRRVLKSTSGRTTSSEAHDLKELAMEADRAVREGESETLPLIAYYSTDRLGNIPRDQARIDQESLLSSRRSATSRLEGYRESVDPKVSVRELVEWIARESWRAFQRRGEFAPTFAVTHEALIRNVDGAEGLTFDAGFGEVVVKFAGGERQPFNNLSDGQRIMLALVGDLSRRAATLNPHLGKRALIETNGVVLIDELDLHLHPKWQRHVIEDLRQTFPALQFVCSTHSPFLIQSLRSGEELVMMDGQPTAHVADLALDEIASGIQGVDRPEVSARYHAMKATARDYLETLDEAERAPAHKLAAYRERLAESVAPFADNPAFQAFLEMKRAAKIGE